MPQSVSPEQRLASLRKLVAYHRRLYHEADAPEISDEAYDSLLLELQTLELEIEGQTTTSGIVGGEVNQIFAKITHAVPQWSFDNVFEYQELVEWDERAKRLLKEADVSTKYTYVAEHKIDGLKLVVTYKKGYLIQAVTRGNGLVGEDVTHTARTIKSIPHQLKDPVDLICVGEVWLSKANFAVLNQKRKQNNLPLFANPRNAAAGSLRQLDEAVAKERSLSFFCYDIDMFFAGETKLHSPQTQFEELSLLTKLGLPTNEHATPCQSLKEIQNFYNQWAGIKDDLIYGVDGIVIKINEISVQEILGYTAKSPRFGVAYKFPAEQRTTVVEEIDLQVGRTGVITPVAHLRPVLIAGSTVARATLHNEDQIKKLDVRVGDTVVIQKAGDVIPEIISVLAELRPSESQAFVFPKYVAGCGGDGRIERVKGEAAHRCVLLDSPLILRRRLYYFISKSALNIDGVGPKLIDQLLDEELISTPADLFTLRYEDIVNLEGFKQKSAENVISAINNAKRQPLYRLLVALGIDGVGEETARLLAQNFGHLTDLFKVKMDDLAVIHGIGPILAQDILLWFSNKSNQSLIIELLKHISIVPDETSQSASQKLQGLTIVATGTLRTMSRDEVKDAIRRHGGTVASSVSKKTDFVVVGAEAGSKADEAVRLGVPILTEDEFLNRIA